MIVYGPRGVCNQADSAFQVKQAGPNWMVTFREQCGPDLDVAFEGSISFSAVPQTPTAPGLKFQPSSGQAQLLIYSAPNALGYVPENTLLKGPAHLDVMSEPNAIDVVMAVEQMPDVLWTVYIEAPSLQTGQTYNARQQSSPHFVYPRLSVSGVLGACNPAMGEFRIEQVQPSIVITFSQTCDGTLNTLVKGKLTYMPAPPGEPDLSAQAVFAHLEQYGEMSLDLMSTGYDPLSGAQGRLQFKGPALVIGRQYGLELHMTREDAPLDIWNFFFTLPRVQQGVLNTVRGKAPNAAFYPTMSITNGHNGRVDFVCKTVSGSFKVEKLAPALVISFRHECDQDSQQLLAGTLTYTPRSALPPTATIAPERLYKGVNKVGQVTLELNSRPRDFMSDKSGQVVIQGAGLIRGYSSNGLEIDLSETPTQGRWEY